MTSVTLAPSQREASVQAIQSMVLEPIKSPCYLVFFYAGTPVFLFYAPEDAGGGGGGAAGAAMGS